MIFKNVQVKHLEVALAMVNLKYEDNIEFRNIEQRGKRIHLTLRVKHSKGPGHRMGFPRTDWHTGECIYKNPRDPLGRKRLIYACWHVHGDFFDALWRIAPDMEVRGGSSLAHPGNPLVYKSPEDNWQDWNMGSIGRPYYMSDACECGN